MRAVVISRYGPPEVLEVLDHPDPLPGHKQIRVRVKAAGINFADLMSRMGIYPGAPEPPFVPGLECCGVVDAAGAEVDPTWVGRRVIAPTWFGGYADILLADPEDVAPLPEGKSFEEGAAFAVTYMTAYHGLVLLGNVQPGDWVLVHVAAGGVGTAAVQLALDRGAVVIGTASASKHDFLKQMGVRHAIDYHTQDFEAEVMRITEGKGVRIVMDPIGGRNFAKSYRCLRRAGVLLLYGLSSAAPAMSRQWLTAAWHYLTSPLFPAMKLMNENKGVHGYHLGRLIPEKELMRREMADLVKLWQDGRINPVVDKVFPYSQAAEAHRYMQEGRNIGKVVLSFA